MNLKLNKDILQMIQSFSILCGKWRNKFSEIRNLIEPTEDTSSLDSSLNFFHQS